VSELFLYFIWQYQDFDHTDLRTTDGEPIQVVHPGFRNNHAGPDFTNARLLINDVEWVGTVEIHVNTSDWLAHKHQYDHAYDNVILHLVWHDDRTTTNKRIDRPDGSPLPTLDLEHRTDSTLLARVSALTDAPDSIPCAGSFRSVQPLRITSMLDKVLLQRLERKAADVKTIFDQTGQDWEETTYRLLAQNMGFKINAGPMLQLASALPLKAIRKHRDAPTQVEAMIFGVAGLLDDPEKGDLEATDDYRNTLRREYRFLAAKYGLADGQLAPHVWKWGRLRPANFPTMRLAQLAQLLSNQASLLSLFVGENSAADLQKAVQVRPSAYWQTHYRFGKAAAKASSTLGETSAENIIINTVVPLLAAYAHHRDQPAYLDRAVALLEQLPPEHNRITDDWNALGLTVKTAFDAQASIELYNQFCVQKRCLQCQIGVAIVKK
jgi:hypothetical protein